MAAPPVVLESADNVLLLKIPHGFVNFQSVKKPSTEVLASLQIKEREAVEVSLPISMHTGQIILLTKMLTAADLRFYGFEGDVPVERWQSRPSGY